MPKIIQYGDIKDDTHIGELCEHLQEAIRNMGCDCGHDIDENKEHSEAYKFHFYGSDDQRKSYDSIDEVIAELEEENIDLKDRIKAFCKNTNKEGA